MACTAAFKPIDPKRDAFRRYLERSGVIEALTKVVVQIVKERPANPLDYLRAHISDAKQQNDEYEYLQKELEEARKEIKRLREIIAASHPEALVEEEQQQQQQQQEVDKAKTELAEQETKIKATNEVSAMAAETTAVEETVEQSPNMATIKEVVEEKST